MALPTEPTKSSDNSGGGGQRTKEKESMASTSSFNRDGYGTDSRISMCWRFEMWEETIRSSG